MSFSDFGYIIIGVIFLVITIIKQRKQMGSTWGQGGDTANVDIESKKLICTHCGNDHFKKREGILATSLVTLFQFTYWNESARCFVCSTCGFVHWFLNRNEKTSNRS